MPRSKSTWLIRHPPVAVPDGSPQRCYGQLDLAAAPGSLPTALAHCLAEFAANPSAAPTHIVSSPLSRCAALAEAMANELGVTLQLEPDLQEINFGEWEGMAWDAVPRAALDAWARAPLTFQLPGGERICAFRARVAAVKMRLTMQQTAQQTEQQTARQAAEPRFAIVTHAGVIRAWCAPSDAAFLAATTSVPFGACRLWTGDPVL